MIVECASITNKETGEDLGLSNSWLTVGRRYTVLAIVGQKEHPYLYVIPSNDQEGGFPIVALPSDFKIITNRISIHWVVNYTGWGTLELIPDTWIDSGFWEGLSDGNPNAVEIYRLARNLIEREES